MRTTVVEFIIHPHAYSHTCLSVDTQRKSLKLKLIYFKPAVKFSTYDDYNRKKKRGKKQN